MVNMKLTFAAMALLPALALAAPTTTTSPSEVETKPFSFSSWVEDLLDPSVVALTPEEAVEAYYASINSTSTSPSTTPSTSPSTEEHSSKMKMAKRAGDPVCYRAEWGGTASRVNVGDAVNVINEMASQGEKYYTIYSGWPTLWMSGAARLSGSLADTADAQRIWAKHVARTGGRIMDYCTWDGTTGGIENGYGNGYTVIRLDNKWA